MWSEKAAAVLVVYLLVSDFEGLFEGVEFDDDSDDDIATRMVELLLSAQRSVLSCESCCSGLL